MNVKQNNWILDHDEDKPYLSPRESVIEMSVKARLRYERTPVWNEMQDTFWDNYINSLSAPVIEKLWTSLGFPDWDAIRDEVTLDEVRHMLIVYFQQEVEKISMPLQTVN